MLSDCSVRIQVQQMLGIMLDINHDNRNEFSGVRGEALLLVFEIQWWI